MPMVSTPVTMSAAPKPAPIASWDMPSDQLSEENKQAGAWFTDGSALYADITQNWTAAACLGQGRTSLKNTGEGIPSLGENSGQLTCSYIVFERRNG